MNTSQLIRNQDTTEYISIPCGSSYTLKIDSDLSDLTVFGWYVEKKNENDRILTYDSEKDKEYVWDTITSLSVYIFEYGKHYLTFYKVTPDLSDTIISFVASVKNSEESSIKFYIKVTSNESSVEKIFPNIDEAIKSKMIFIEKNNDTITVNPFHSDMYYLAVQINVVDMALSVSSICVQRITKEMDKNKNIAVNIKFEEFPDLDAEFIADMMYFAFKTINHYNKIPEFSSTWSEFVDRTNFTLIMLAGRLIGMKYWWIAHISECYENNKCISKLFFLKNIVTGSFDLKLIKIRDERP
ncbi:hypothetical protein HZS_205, partial [Henneguya salminicola]